MKIHRIFCLFGHRYGEVRHVSLLPERTCIRCSNRQVQLPITVDGKDWVDSL